MEPQEKKHKLLKPMLTILIGIILIGGTGFGIWYWQQNEIKKQKTDSDTRIAAIQKDASDSKKKEDENKAKADAEAKASSNWRTYINNLEGFQLTFLDTWKGYAITETLSDDHHIKYIAFGLPSTKTCDSCDWGYDRNYHNIFSISIYPKNDWAVANSEEGPKPTKIGEKGDKVYAYMHGNGIPMVTVTDAYADTKEIIKSFKLLE